MLKNSLILMVFMLVCGKANSQTHDYGSINGADYIIQIPKNWNGGLVMYAHGYEEVGEKTEGFGEFDEFMKIFLSRGYAYAASAYKRQGLVIKDGIEDTEALRSYFEMKYGKPDICIITGHSMGGMISLATIEKYPLEYDGALPLCGWLAPVHSLLKRTLDMLATYDYLFGDNDGIIVTGKRIIEQDSIECSLGQKPKIAELYAEHFRVRKEDLAEIIEFYQHVFKECSAWLGGLPAGNLQSIYSGFGDNDQALNKSILRYDAKPETEEYFMQYFTPSGEIQDPVITYHTTYDEILPAFSYKYYEQLTELKHTDSLYIQKYAVRDGHCNFTGEEIGEAFGQLIEWIKKGNRPANEYK